MLGFDIHIVISDFLKYSQSFLDKEAFKYWPDIRKLGISDITEDEFYKLIGLTRQEIQQIKNQPSNDALDAAEEPQHDDDANEEDAAALEKRPAKKNTSRKLQPQLEPGSAVVAAAVANPDKIWNPVTNRWVINNPANQKKIGKLTLKKGGKKKKSFKQKHSKTKKHA
jgi:hypothetical protein